MWYEFFFVGFVEIDFELDNVVVVVYEIERSMVDFGVGMCDVYLESFGKEIWGDGFYENGFVILY